MLTHLFTLYTRSILRRGVCCLFPHFLPTMHLPSRRHARQHAAGGRLYICKRAAKSHITVVLDLHGFFNRFWIYRYASRVCSEAKTTELLQEVSHRKWRDFALCRLLSAAFLGNTFSSNPVDSSQFMHNSLYLVTKFVKPLDRHIWNP